jgi:hypothetical protein
MTNIYYEVFLSEQQDRLKLQLDSHIIFYIILGVL